jgi:hypothetical protein
MGRAQALLRWLISRGRLAGRGEFWAAHREGWRGSGLSQREYCERHGLALSTFQVWNRRLACETEGKPRFEIVPVAQVTRSAGARPLCPVVLVMGGGRYRLEIREGVAAETVRALLDVLNHW